MLRSEKKLEGFAIGATDGAIGKVKDFYFDDEAWVIRYLVVDTSRWLGGRDVLISPYSLGTPDWEGKTLPVTITTDQVRNSPGVDSDQPVSRQYERIYLGYYDYPYYWGGTGLWGAGNYPGVVPLGRDVDPFGSYQGYLRAPSDRDAGNDPHLRSCETVRGYHIVAADGGIGHIDGFLVDDTTWSIRYLVVNTSNWWVGHKVLLSPEWIEKVSWQDSTVTTNLDREAIRKAPVYDDSVPAGRDYEGALYLHYSRAGYWHDPLPRVA